MSGRYRSAAISEILAREPVDRVARWVTIQPPEEVALEPKWAREEVPAPTKGKGSETFATCRGHIQNVRREIRALERRLRAIPRPPKFERQRLGAEIESLSTIVRQWRGGDRRSFGTAKSVRL